jgi:thymidylate synthase
VKQYLDLVNEVLKRGTRKENRTGVDTISAFNINYSIDLNEGFPLLTTKEISWKNIVIENLWFLSGDLHIGLLKKHGCKFWDHWADDEGYVPSAYGNFWRKFPIHGSDEYNDQVKYVLNTLKTNPNSRRMVISAWAPGNAQKSGLPPCHLLFIFNVQYDKDGEPRLCVHLTQRSCDVALGVPYNIAGYSFLLHLFAHLSNMKVGTFGHTLVDAHIYTKKADGSMDEYDHIPGLIEQTKRKIKSLPELVINPDIKSLEDVMDLLDKDTETIMSKFELKNYNPEPFIRFKVAV